MYDEMVSKTELPSADGALSKAGLKQKVATIIQLRRILAEAYGFLEGLRNNQQFAAYDLSQSIADRIAEIQGPSRGPSGMSKLDKLDRITGLLTTATKQAATVDGDDLSTLDISELGSGFRFFEGFGDLGNLLGGAQLGLSALEGLPNPGDLDGAASGLAGKLPEVPGTPEAEQLQELSKKLEE